MGPTDHFRCRPLLLSGAWRLLLFLAILLGTGLRAQAPGGRISGEAFSLAPNGERYAVPGAQVVLTPVPGAHPPSSKPVRMESVADETGRFSFEKVPSGCYRASATSAGLTGEGDEVCLLAPGGAISVAIEMKPEIVRESVEVTAAREQIETTETSSKGTIESSTLANAPNVNERFEGLLPLIPGVIRGPDGLINMKGARATQGGALVNSANVTDPVTGGTAINLPVDVISEVSVLSNPYDAQYGKFAGAVSTVHTQVSDFDKFRFKVQNFMPRMRKRDGDIIGIESATPRLKLSGPVIKGRLALTQSFEYRFVRTEIEGAGLPQLERDTQLESFDSFTQADIQIGDHHTATLNLSFYPQKQNFFGLNTFTPQSATPNLRQRGYMIGGQDTYAFNSGSLLQTRLSFKTFDANVKANSLAPFRDGIEISEGGFFNLQSRDTSRFEWTEAYHFAPWQAGGQHLFKAGFNFTRNVYDGRQSFDTVDILGVSDRLVERIDFSGSPVLLDVTQNEYSFFVQDQWTPWRRLTLDLGLRFDRDSIADDSHPAPRAGFAYLLTNDNKTVLRGGIGFFYDRINLNVPTFLDLPGRTETRFSSIGTPFETRAYRHRLAINDIRNPLSLGWSVQLDRELLRNLVLRTGFQQRVTTRNFLLNPEATLDGDFLTLSNQGRDRYREFEVTAKYRLGSKSHLTASYVRSSSIGDLNDLNSIFGNAGQGVIRANERSFLPFNAPNRFLFWADVAAPFKVTVSPVVDVHTGFPFSTVDEQLDFVGPRNEGGKFPRFATVDLQILKEIKLPIKDGLKARIGIRIFNLLNSFNPVDLQNNVASPRFGTFFNSRDRQFRGKFIIDF